MTRILLGLVASAFIASTASANLVVNNSFEEPAIGGGDFQCLAGSCPGWSDFGAAFVVDETALAGFPGALSGDQVLKVFGGTSGVFQQYAANEGELWEASAYGMNFAGDPLTGGQIGAVNLDWIAADGTTILSSEFGGTIDASTQMNVWQFLSASGVAPAGTAFARITVITGNFGGDPSGGAAFFDDASLRLVPIPAAVWLFGSALLGLMGLRRR